MTEEEAKTKWCPFARLTFSTEGFAAGNRFDDCAWAEKRALCIGSDCMAWRWSVKDYPGEGGFCGLAGTP
jgi:hypothetical protein